MKERMSVEEINILLKMIVEKLRESNKKVVRELEKRHRLEDAMKYLSNALQHDSIAADETEIFTQRNSFRCHACTKCIENCIYR